MLAIVLYHGFVNFLNYFWSVAVAPTKDTRMYHKYFANKIWYRYLPGRCVKFNPFNLRTLQHKIGNFFIQSIILFWSIAQLFVIRPVLIRCLFSPPRWQHEHEHWFPLTQRSRLTVEKKAHQVMRQCCASGIRIWPLSNFRIRPLNHAGGGGGGGTEGW